MGRSRGKRTEREGTNSPSVSQSSTELGKNHNHSMPPTPTDGNKVSSAATTSSCQEQSNNMPPLLILLTYLQPNQRQLDRDRDAVVKHLQQALQYPVFAFGSSVTGFILKNTSDIDVCIVTDLLKDDFRKKDVKNIKSSKQGANKRQQTSSTLSTVLHGIQASLMAYDYTKIQVLQNAAVPLVKCITPQIAKKNWDIDISMNNTFGVRNSRLIKAYATCPLMHDLGFLVKYWAHRNWCIDTYHGYMSSYSCLLLVVYFLQQYLPILPCLEHLREDVVAASANKGTGSKKSGSGPGGHHQERENELEWGDENWTWESCYWEFMATRSSLVAHEIDDLDQQKDKIDDGQIKTTTNEDDLLIAELRECMFKIIGAPGAEDSGGGASLKAIRWDPKRDIDVKLPVRSSGEESGEHAHSPDSILHPSTAVDDQARPRGGNISCPEQAATPAKTSTCHSSGTLSYPALLWSCFAHFFLFYCDEFNMQDEVVCTTVKQRVRKRDRKFMQGLTPSKPHSLCIQDPVEKSRFIGCGAGKPQEHIEKAFRSARNVFFGSSQSKSNAETARTKNCSSSSSHATPTNTSSGNKQWIHDIYPVLFNRRNARYRRFGPRHNSTLGFLEDSDKYSSYRDTEVDSDTDKRTITLKNGKNLRNVSGTPITLIAEDFDEDEVVDDDPELARAMAESLKEAIFVDASNVQAPSFMISKERSAPGGPPPNEVEELLRRDDSSDDPELARALAESLKEAAFLEGSALQQQAEVSRKGRDNIIDDDNDEDLKLALALSLADVSPNDEGGPREAVSCTILPQGASRADDAGSTKSPTEEGKALDIDDIDIKDPDDQEERKRASLTALPSALEKNIPLFQDAKDHLTSTKTTSTSDAKVEPSQEERSQNLQQNGDHTPAGREDRTPENKPRQEDEKQQLLHQTDAPHLRGAQEDEVEDSKEHRQKRLDGAIRKLAMFGTSSRGSGTLRHIKDMAAFQTQRDVLDQLFWVKVGVGKGDVEERSLY